MNTLARALTVVALFGTGALTGLWIGNTTDHGSAAHPQTDASTTAVALPADRKPLYYRNPMGLPDTSPVPKKDNMGMDYIPVYADEPTDDAGAGTNTLRIPLARVQKIGVRSEAASLRPLDRSVTALGVIEADERSLSTVAPRFAGWIDTLHGNATGPHVRRGDVLFEAYSPELLAAQQDYLIALDAASSADREFAAGLMRSARARLVNAEMDTAQIRALETRREPLRTVALRASRNGVVLERNAVAGMRFAAGDTLLRIADLDSVWLVANVSAQDMAEVRLGQPATLSIDGFPGESFSGHVGFIYPTLDEVSRTTRVRIELPNASLRLRPGMYGRAVLQATQHEAVVTVPDSALIDSGLRQLVLVEHATGEFEPRPVVAGRRGGGLVEILSGLHDGERVVVRANFLIDSESNLRAALDGLASAGESSSAAPAQMHHDHGGH